MTSKFVLKGMLPLCASFALLAACGDDDSSSVFGGGESSTKKESVEKFKNLEKCTKSLDGDTVYVEADEADYVCDDGEWVKVSDEDESSSSKGGKSSSSGKDDKSSSSDKDSSSSKGESSSSKGDDSSDSKDVSSSSLSDVEKALGICDSATADSVGKIEKKTYFCKDGKWNVVGGMDEVIGVCRKAIYDSIASTAGKTYICEESGWVNISELDVKLGKCTKAIADSMAQYGDYYYRCNVDDSLAQWIKIELAEYEVGKCSEALLDTVVELMEWGLNKYFSCEKVDKEYVWKELNGVNQADVYRWPEGKDGDARWGDFDTSACYVYDSENKKDYGQGWLHHPKDSLSCMKGMTGCTFLRADTLIKNGETGESYRCYASTMGSPVWVKASEMEIEFGVCREAIVDSVFKKDDKYHVCKYYVYQSYSGYTWGDADPVDYDTYHWEKGKIGDTAPGDVTGELYYYGKNGWTYLTRWSWDVPLEVRFKKDFSYGTLEDGRDNKVYKTVKIGEQTWMAENLNYIVPGQSWCFKDSSEYCKVGGRLYTWGAAIDSAALANDLNDPQTCGQDHGIESCDLTGKVVKGVCPKGWHLPSAEEWTTLYEAVGSDPEALKSETGWILADKYLNGTNESGFTALPIGYGIIGDFYHLDAYFWTSTLCGDGRCNPGNGDTDTYAGYTFIGGWESSGSKRFITGEGRDKKTRYSVRCVKDSED